MIRRPLWVPLDAEPSAEKPVCTARTDTHTHTHTHTHTPQRSPRASCSGKERSWSGCENLNTSCLDGCSCWHQTLVRKSQPEEKEGWRKSIRAVEGGGGVPSHPPRPFPTSNTPAKSCSLLVSRSSPNTLPPAPPLLLPHAKTASRPVTVCVRPGPQPGGWVCGYHPRATGCSLGHKTVPGKLTCVPLCLALPPPPDAPTYPLSTAFGSR